MKIEEQQINKTIRTITQCEKLGNCCFRALINKEISA